MTQDTSGIKSDIAERIQVTPLIDTHEHLVEEADRTEWQPFGQVPCDDWSALLSGYLASDLASAGMPGEAQGRFFSSDTPWQEKWPLVEAFWPAVSCTGYGRALRNTLRLVYGIDELSGDIIDRLEEAYHATIRPGFYPEVLCKIGGIESCQVNSLRRLFTESALPMLLMQDISFLQMHSGPAIQAVAGPMGLEVSDLAGFHAAIDAWFARYGRYAVAVKSQAAYSRRLDYEDVPAEKVEAVFGRVLNGDPVDWADRKPLEDHLFWYSVRKATEYGLPVKLHTGYYAGCNSMPLARVATGPGDVCELVRRAPETTFVLMHIGYPYHEEMIALAKQWSNAVIDICWAWIINPEASVRFLRDFLVAAPANKVLTFGGDYSLVEQTVGHAAVARQGIGLALSQLVDRGWLSSADAMGLLDPLMHGNARRIFRLDEKARLLASAAWAK